MCNTATLTDYIYYYEIFDEITFEGEKVLPFAQYSDKDPEPKIVRYLQTNGNKVYWRSTDPEYTDWYLLYDFGLKEGEVVEIYIQTGTGKVSPVSLKCLRFNYYEEKKSFRAPLMRLQVLKFDGIDMTSYGDYSEEFQGDWIIGMGYLEGPGGSILEPCYWRWVGGGYITLCVESPKGNVVYGSPVAGIKTVSDNSQQTANEGVYNMQGIRVADSTDNLSAGLYIIDGKKVAITK